MNAPWTVEVPSRIVGLACLMVASRSGCRRPPRLGLGRRPGVGLLVVPQVGHVVAEQAGLSTSQIWLMASSRLAPSWTMASRSASAIPQPAVPEPNTTRRWSRNNRRVTFSAEMTAASTMAPVPWTSSLKIR